MQSKQTCRYILYMYIIKCTHRKILLILEASVATAQILVTVRTTSLSYWLHIWSNLTFHIPWHNKAFSEAECTVINTTLPLKVSYKMVGEVSSCNRL